MLKGATLPIFHMYKIATIANFKLSHNITFRDGYLAAFEDFAAVDAMWENVADEEREKAKKKYGFFNASNLHTYFLVLEMMR